MAAIRNVRVISVKARSTRGFAARLLARPHGREIRVGALPYLLRKERGPGEQIGRDKVRRFFRELEPSVCRKPAG